MSRTDESVKRAFKLDVPLPDSVRIVRAVPLWFRNRDQVLVSLQPFYSMPTTLLRFDFTLF